MKLGLLLGLLLVCSCGNESGSQGPSGQQGISGPIGEQGNAGASGSNGVQGPAGQNSSIASIASVLQLCPSVPKDPSDEVLLQIGTNGPILRQYIDSSGVRMIVLQPGSYNSQDSRACAFSIDNHNNIITQ